MYGYVDITGYEGLYAINRQGEIWSYYANKILSQKHTYRGYYCVGLRKKGIARKFCLVHRLVANTFIPNPENKPDVNHIDCNKLNNYVENLEWCTASENMQHAKANRLVNTPEQQNKIRESCGYLTIEQANEIRRLYETKKYTQKSVGALFGVSDSVVYWILKNKTYRELKYV